MRWILPLPLRHLAILDNPRDMDIIHPAVALRFLYHGKLT